MHKQIVHIVYQVRQDHPTMGIRDIFYKIRPKGVGRDVFEDICRQEGLMIARPINWRRTTDSTGVIRFEDLTVGFVVDSINKLWQSDITYYELGNRFYYLTFIQDRFSRVIVGYSVSDDLTTIKTTYAALKGAIAYRKGMNLKGLILHSDGGGQYYAKVFIELTEAIGIRNSMCQYPWDNGMAERLNGVIKNNYLKHRKIKNLDQLQKEVDRSVRLYNHEKPHIELKRQVPFEYEMKIVTLQKQTRAMVTESFDANTQSGGALSPFD